MPTENSRLCSSNTKETTVVLLVAWEVDLEWEDSEAPVLRTHRESIKIVLNLITTLLQAVVTQDPLTTQLLQTPEVAVVASSHSQVKVTRLVDRDQNLRFS